MPETLNRSITHQAVRNDERIATIAHTSLAAIGLGEPRHTYRAIMKTVPQGLTQASFNTYVDLLTTYIYDLGFTIDQATRAAAVATTTVVKAQRELSDELIAAFNENARTLR